MPKTTVRSTCFLLILATLVCTIGCSESTEIREYAEIHGETMGTHYTIKYYSAEGRDPLARLCHLLA